MDNDGKNPKNRKRRTKYDTHIEPNFEVILGMLRSKYTEQGIAESLGVSISTWKRHKTEEKEFRDVVILGQRSIAALCVNSLYKLAHGYDYDEIHTEVTDAGPLAPGSQSQSRPTRRVIKKITKHVPGNVAANLAILFNRDPLKWKDKHEIHHSGEIKQSGVLYTEKPLENTKEWDKYVQTLQEKAGLAPPKNDKPSSEPRRSGAPNQAASKRS